MLRLHVRSIGVVDGSCRWISSFSLKPKCTANHQSAHRSFLCGNGHLGGSSRRRSTGIDSTSFLTRVSSSLSFDSRCRQSASRQRSLWLLGRDIVEACKQSVSSVCPLVESASRRRVVWLPLSDAATQRRRFLRSEGDRRSVFLQSKLLPQSRCFGSSSTAGNFDVYHAGLLKTEFTNDLIIDSSSPTIPIFRILSPDGVIESGTEGEWTCPFAPERLVQLYKFMTTLSIWDDMMYSIQRQGRISFYIQNQGEEAVQTGVGNALSVEDHLWCQYRELGVLMARGFQLEDALAQCFSTKDDEGKGRQMPVSYTKKSLNLQTICTPLTTQVPHAAGAGYAFKLGGEKRCSVAFFGEGAASEGDFHAAMNFASVLKCQAIFICRNNGYAISTPVRDQYAGDGIAIRGIAYGMKTIRVDGNDLFAVYIATKKCRDICINESVPVCMEFMTYRMGHHSTSDDSSQYRPKGEFDAWAQAGLHPIMRVRKYLESNGLWDATKEEAVRAEAKQTMLAKLKAVEKVKKFALVPGLFDDVYAEPHWHIEKQRQSFKEHLERHKDKYDVSSFESVS